MRRPAKSTEEMATIGIPPKDVKIQSVVMMVASYRFMNDGMYKVSWSATLKVTWADIKGCSTKSMARWIYLCKEAKQKRIFLRLQVKKAKAVKGLSLSGDTYKAKDFIKKFGGVWNPETKSWSITKEGWEDMNAKVRAKFLKGIIAE